MINYKIISFLIFLFFIASCNSLTGLEPVSGVEGNLAFDGDWDPEIQAATVIALDDLDLDNPAINLVTYSNLIDPGKAEAEYFIQLLPGTYYLAVVGITVDPGFFAVKLDSFLTSENIPLKIIDNDLRNLTTAVSVESQQITRSDRTIVF
jgi:hypothetical protein